MDRKFYRIMRNSVLYTILKYSDLIDFSPIQNVDCLAYRYLLLNILKLKELKKERKKNELKNNN